MDIGLSLKVIRRYYEINGDGNCYAYALLLIKKGISQNVYYLWRCCDIFSYFMERIIELTKK